MLHSTYAPRGVIALLALLVVPLLALACGDGGGDNNADPTATGATVESGNSITVGDQTWEVVPGGQCQVLAGEFASIAGHADGDESIEIGINYNLGADRGAVRVQAAGGDPHWMANEDALEVEIEGDTVTGSGTFTAVATGDTADGSFAVTC